ncbi:MAG: hypothetical protein WBP38_04440 [Hyphomicrobium sp.]|nr:hypothetical protein [Hyphomicrobium sp.]
MMKRALFAVACCLAVSPVQAAGVDAATITKSIDAATADPVKAKAYCDLAAKFDEVGDDEKKAEAAGSEIDAYFQTLGAEFEAAWDAGQNAEETSPEGKAFDAAMTKLDATCGAAAAPADAPAEAAPAEAPAEAPADAPAEAPKDAPAP